MGLGRTERLDGTYVDSYLNPLDHEMEQQGIEMVRYADDWLILCRSQAEAEKALELVRQWTASTGLQLHPDKTRIVDATQRGGFDFLGYHFERNMKWPRPKSLKKFKDTIRGKTKRTNGFSLQTIIEKIEAVTVNAIQELANHLFDPGCMALTLLGPSDSDKKAFEEILFH